MRLPVQRRNRQKSRERDFRPAQFDGINDLRESHSSHKSHKSHFFGIVFDALHQTPHDFMANGKACGDSPGAKAFLFSTKYRFMGSRYKGDRLSGECAVERLKWVRMMYSGMSVNALK